MSAFGVDNCCRNLSISLVSSEGKTVNVNKYFLMIYNEFYRSLLTELQSDDVTIVYDDFSFADLLSFQKLVNEKYFKCTTTVEDPKEQKPYKAEIETKKDTSDSKEEENILEASEENITEESNKKSLIRSGIKCPFNCEKAFNNCICSHLY